MPTKTNAQIQKEYDALPWYAKVPRAVGDIANIAGNALTFGLVNKAAQAATGASDQAVADMEHAERVRAGLAGDVANVGGLIYGGKAALGAGKAALGLVRTAPVASALSRTAGLGTAARYLVGAPAVISGEGRAVAGATQAALNEAAASGASREALTALARGSVGASKGALVPVVESAPITARAAAGTIAKALGIGGLFGASVAARQEQTPLDPKDYRPNTPIEDIPDPVAAARAAGAAAGPQSAITPYDQQRQFLATLLNSPLTLQEAQGVMGLTPRAPHDQTEKDKVYGTASSIIDAQYQQELAAAEKLGAQADIDAARIKATDDYRKRYAALAGVNPAQDAIAAIMAQQEAQ